MSELIVEGGNKILGEMTMYPAKNSVLPILAASILTEDKCTIFDCPDIVDVKSMSDILEVLGAKVVRTKRGIVVDGSGVDNYYIPNMLACKLRSSVFLMGSILARKKKAVLAYPGGCDIGLRPINLHIKALKDLNVSVKEENGYIFCDGKNMKAGEVALEFPSVGTTENIMMAASLLKGRTVIKNAAKEPEIVDLANYINKMGGKVRGAGRSSIEIEGVAQLKGCKYTPMPDRIVAGTYLIAAAITAGEIELKNVVPDSISSIISKLRESTCKIDVNNDKIRLTAPKRLNCVRSTVTSPYPGFPTDLQAQFVALSALSKGVSIVEERMFETRFRHVPELIRMGADITIKGNTAIIGGVSSLYGTEVKCYDLRGGAAMVVAALAAKGKTTILDCGHIDRGYPSIDGELNMLGAKITRK